MIHFPEFHLLYGTFLLNFPSERIIPIDKLRKLILKAAPRLRPLKL